MAESKNILSLIISKIRHHFFNRAFIMFLVVGCINTFNGVFLAWLLEFVSPWNNLNFNIGYIIGNIVAYWLNCKLVFPSPMSVRQYVRFAISYIPNYLIQNIIVLIFFNWLGFPSVVSYIIAAILGIPVTFLMVKIFTFKQK